MSDAKQMQEDLGVNKTVILKYPVRLPTGQMLTEVTLRRARVGDIRAVSHLSGDSEQELAIFARLTGLVPEDLDMLDIADYKVLQETFRTTQEQ
ncbi:phage tail assembly protein [Uruburuella testudinis]|uniref:Phage tail assembly protein n=1 Tax=Uruburuella testudinis TaxID=1282863 RepID=A0ABY4DWB1_9NEIS|nr:phage tail assembly protein [Uruburuella testudinis]UOO82768.1 phage tail assembly protein [Uruburuella testudinis]